MDKSEFEEKRPPYSSTGVTRTAKTPLTACVDWFSCTFFSIESWIDCAGILALDFHEFQLLDRGKFGYQKTAFLGEIKIYYEGQNSMGIHLEMGGQACRQYETYFDDGLNWTEFFALCLNWDINISRLDIALDDFNKRLNFNRMVNKLKKGEITSKFKKARDFREYLIKTGEKIGETLYFGKGTVMFRFYDKRAERLNKGYELKREISSWQRYEIQLRDERAKRAVEILAYRNYDVGEFCMGLMKEYITFRDKHKTDTNKSRWEVSRFWEKFLGDVEKIGLTQVAPEQSILKTKNWITNQVIGSLAMLKEAVADDELLHEYISVIGSQRISDKQVERANDFKRDLGQLLDLKLNMRREINEGKEKNSIACEATELTC